MTRLLLSLLITLVVQSSAWAANAYVGADSYDYTAGQNPTLSLGTVSAGNCIVGAVWWDDQTNTLSSITGATTTIHGQGNVPNLNCCRGAAFSITNASGGSTTLTFNFSASVNSWAVTHEVSGCDTSAAYDNHSIDGEFPPGTGTDALNGTAITPAADGAYYFASCNDMLNSSDQTAGTDFTAASSTGNTRFIAEYYVQSTAASKAATCTVGAPGTGSHMITTVVLKAASAAADTSKFRLRINP